MLLLNPLLKTSADLVAKQIEFEKRQSLSAEAERALELIGRAIRIAGYRISILSSSTSKRINGFKFIKNQGIGDLIL